MGEGVTTDSNEALNITADMFPIICRVCFSCDENLKSIFETIDGVLNGASILSSFGIPEITESDNLPQNICETCLQKLYEINQIIQACREAEQKLREIKKSSFNTQIEHDYCNTVTPELKPEEDKSKTKIIKIVNSSKDDKSEDVVKYIEIQVNEGQDCGEIVQEWEIPEGTTVFEEGEYETIKFEYESVDEAEADNEEIVEEENEQDEEKEQFNIVNDEAYKSGNDKLIQCKLCPLTFNNMSNYSRHKYVHLKKKPHKCEYCEKSFTRKESLKIHQKYHTGENHHVCKLCNKQFTTLSNYNRHKQTHQLNDGSLTAEQADAIIKSITCDVCKKMFSSKHTLRTHMLLHQPKLYTCDVCGKKFTFHGNLRSHYRSHTGEKPFKCEYCSKTFSFRSSLKEHIYTHTGEKPHICEFCKKGFAQHQQLKTHVRIHTGERPYSCEFCHKTFANKVNMTVHVRIHTGDTPFVCSICDKGFYDSSSLKKHKKRHEDIGNKLET